MLSTLMENVMHVKYAERGKKKKKEKKIANVSKRVPASMEFHLSVKQICDWTLCL